MEFYNSINITLQFYKKNAMHFTRKKNQEKNELLINPVMIQYWYCSKYLSISLWTLTKRTAKCGKLFFNKKILVFFLKIFLKQQHWWNHLTQLLLQTKYFNTKTLKSTFWASLRQINIPIIPNSLSVVHYTTYLTRCFKNFNATFITFSNTFNSSSSESNASLKKFTLAYDGSIMK